MWFAAVLALASQMHADDTTALMDRLQRASTINAIDDPQLKPWHLKLSLQLFDDKGKPTEKGMVEEWWEGPSMYKTVYSSPSYTSTEIQTKDGFYRTKGVSSVPNQIELALRQVVHPMPGERDIADTKPDLRKETFGKTPMDCIMLSQELKNVAYAPLGLFPLYCFDRGQDNLRVSYDYGSQLTVRNRLGSFQARTVAIDQTTSFGPFTAVSAHVETLESLALNDEMFVPTTELEKVEMKPVMVASGVIQGYRISFVPPIYPASAKRNRVSGSVILRARIGRDGRIHGLKVISTPDGDLAISSLAAVRQWTYKPYLLNGEPVEVDTQITVNFAIGN